MTGDQPQVSNPYRNAIEHNRQLSVAPAHTLGTLFDDAVKAMESGAWTGGAAGELHSALTSHKTAAKKAAGDALQEFDDAAAAQPRMVDANSWQVHWHNLSF